MTIMTAMRIMLMMSQWMVFSRIKQQQCLTLNYIAEHPMMFIMIACIL